MAMNVTWNKHDMTEQEVQQKLEPILTAFNTQIPRNVLNVMTFTVAPNGVTVTHPNRLIQSQIDAMRMEKGV